MWESGHQNLIFCMTKDTEYCESPHTAQKRWQVTCNVTVKWTSQRLPSMGLRGLSWSWESHPASGQSPPHLHTSTPLLVVLRVKANHYRWICPCISLTKPFIWVFKNKLKMQGDGCFLWTQITFFFTCSFYFHIDGFLSITIYKSIKCKELSSCSVE